MIWFSISPYPKTNNRLAKPGDAATIADMSDQPPKNQGAAKWAARFASIEPGRQALASPAPISAAVNTPASFWQRCYAYLADYLLFLIPAYVFLWLATPAPPDASQVLNWLVPCPGASPVIPSLCFSPPGGITGLLMPYLLVAIVPFVAWAFYHIAFEAVYATTPGKYLFGLSTRLDPDKNAWLSASLRHCHASISWLTLNIGHCLALSRADQKTLHDLTSNTGVIDNDAGLGSLPPLAPQQKQMARIVVIVLAILLILFTTIRVVSAMQKALSLLAM